MGAMTTGAKQGKIDWRAMRPAAEQMAALNDKAAQAMLAAGVRACTDVTGFGLLGHGRNLAVASGVTLRIEAEKVPVFPGALELARRGVLSGGAKRGRRSLAGEVRVAEGLDEALVNLCFDAETSGGLLIAVPPRASATLEAELAARGLPVRRIGEFAARSDVAVELR
jgi:selenide,water dikinase